MDFYQIAKTRCSIRSYTNQKVEPEKLEGILEAAHVVLTTADIQPIYPIVVQGGGLEKIGKAAHPQGSIRLS